MKKMKVFVLILACLLSMAGCSSYTDKEEITLTDTVENINNGDDSEINDNSIPKAKNNTTYKVEIADNHPIANSLKSTYEAGEQITIKLETITEQYYLVRVNDVSIDFDREVSDMMYTYYTFTMPNEEVIVKIEEISVDIPEAPYTDVGTTDTVEGINNGDDSEIIEGVIRILRDGLDFGDKDTLTFDNGYLESIDIKSNETAEALFHCIRNCVRIVDLTGAALEPMHLPIKMNGKELVPSTYDCLYIDYPKTEQFLCIVFSEDDSAAFYEYIMALAATK